MERLFDINLRVRRPAFNIAVFYMILVGFFDSLLISRFASSMVSIVLLYLFQPFLVFGVPVLFLKLHEKKYSQAFARSAYTPPKARKRDIVLVALTALTAWLFYTYSIYAAEGFRAAATGGLSLYIPPRPSLWQLFLSLVVNAVFAAGLREYAFRYLGRKAYGRTIWGIAFASLLSAFVSYDLLIAIRLFILGVGSAAIFCGTKRMRFCFIFAFVFEGLQTIVPSYWILPLSTYAAVSIETSVLYGLFSAAAALIFAAVLYWLFRSVRFQPAKGTFRFKRSAVLTFVLCFAAFAALTIWNKFI